MHRFSKYITTAAIGLTSFGLLTLHSQQQSSLPPQPAPPVKYKKRSEHLKDIAATPEYDIVIIGGGCNGVGVLLDAATRGFKTLLI